MEQPFPEGAMRLAVVARVFGKDHRKREILKKLGRSLIGRIGGEPLGIPLHTLAKSAIAVRRLVESGVEARIEKRDGIERVLYEEDKFIPGAESAKKNAGPVARRMNRFSLERVREKPHGLFHGAVVILEADNGKGFDAGWVRVLQHLRGSNIRSETSLRTAHLCLRCAEAVDANDSGSREKREKPKQVVRGESQVKFSIIFSDRRPSSRKRCHFSWIDSRYSHRFLMRCRTAASL